MTHTPPLPKSGMVLGKFMPPHEGHLHLIEFAKNYAEDLTVVVCTLKSEPIPGNLRYTWMREIFPGLRIMQLTDEIPQDPTEHPNFWKIWHDSLLRVLPQKPDYVFASESYGWKLAETLGAEFVPCPLERITSGTAIRNNPYQNWRFLPNCVRPYFLRRICIIGPESTGKTTLEKDLAKQFDTLMVPEYARTLLEAQGGKITAADIPKIARGQIASEEALARYANKLLICDTDLLTTFIWSEVLFGDCPSWIRQEVEKKTYDLYLLTDLDVPWVPDPVRYLPHDRDSFLDRCIQELKSRRRKYIQLSGSKENRLGMAREAVEELIKAPLLRQGFEGRCRNSPESF